jgi:hypothetical protein
MERYKGRWPFRKNPMLLEKAGTCFDVYVPAMPPVTLSRM